MKKVLLTSMILLSTVSYGGNVYAQETSGDAPAATTPTTAKASVTFTPSVDGKTLTISGQGDLTSYMTTDFSASVFTEKAVGFVFADAAGNISVAAGDSYNAGKTYYQAEYNYTKVWETEPTSWNHTVGFGNVTSRKDWKEDKIGNLYMGYISNNAVTIEKKVSDNTNYINIDNDILASWNLTTIDGSQYVKVFVVEGDVPTSPVSLDELAANGIQLISKSDFISDYIVADVTYQVTKSLFVSHDEGNNYVSLTSGVDYKWTPGDVFYEGTATYAQIESNDAFFGKTGTHPDFIKADERTLSFNDLLLRKITEGAYENVEFVNEGSDKLLIDATSVQNILYPNASQNVSIKDLNLGQATIENLSGDVFKSPSASHLFAASLKSLTLPLTNLTTVVSPTTNTNVEKMVVPTGVIPDNYNNVAASLTTITIPEGYDYVGEKAFCSLSNLKEINFPNTLRYIGNSAFEGCANMESVTLNEGLENIGKDAFKGGRQSKLSSVNFPSSLKIINDGAFYGAHIMNLKFHAGLKYIGKAAFGLTEYSIESVLEIPASVRYIGPAAFNFRQYQDVYFYGETAPLMPIGSATEYDQAWTACTAFSEHTLDGNGGFSPSKGTIADDANTGYANRENYKDGHNNYMCVLHYPKDLEDDGKKNTYTDVTRIYKTDPSENFHYRDTDGGWNGTEGADIVGQESEDASITFGNCTAFKRVNWGYQDTYLGPQYIWPSQAQFNRAYATASNGLCWNGVDEYIYELTDDDIATLKYAGYVIGEGEGEYTKEQLGKIAHMGTRQFVLANADVTKDDKPEEDPTYPINIKGGEWWTLCVPFNMTKSQVTEVFGAETRVCIFNKVERLVDRANQARYIRLYFTKDAYLHKTTVVNDKIQMDDNSSTGDDDIVIYAHQSYMIYPKKSSEDANNMYNIADYQLVTGSPLPTLVKANETVDGNMGTMAPDEGDEWNKEYRFVGNYQTQVAETQSTENQSAGVATQAFKTVTIPQYSYIYAKKTGAQTAQFWFYTGTTAAWGANKCVVQATARDGGKVDFENYFGGGSSVTAKQAIQQSFFGDNGEATGVDNFVIIAGEAKDAQIVYNLNGQIVNNNGNLDGLQKGVYIKNGKKYMVK